MVEDEKAAVGLDLGYPTFITLIYSESAWHLLQLIQKIRTCMVKFLENFKNKFHHSIRL